MAYKAPIWEDGKSPAISAENLNNLSQAAEGAQVLYGNSAPTSSTEGAVGQFYLVVVADSDGNYPLYQCVAIANGSYVWRDTRRIPDSITSMLGIPAPGTINRALNVLANVGNLHVWERKCLAAEAGYTLGDLETVNITHGAGANYSSGNYSSWVYSDKISVNETGVVSLVNPTETNDLYYDAYSNANVLAGKYAQINPNISPTHSLAKLGFVYFFPAGNSASRNTDDGSYNITLPGKIVTGYPAETTTDYLTSTDRNAYPDSVTDAQDAYYTLGDVVSGYLFASAWDGNASNYYYSETIKVSDTGTLTQENVKHYTANATNDSWVSNIQSAIRGKFITVSGETNNGGSEGTNLVYIPDDAIVSYFENGVSLGYPYNYGFLVNKMQPVTGHAAIPASTTITYLGQLGGGGRIEVVSYVGTGTYGSSNPNSLAFGFVPKYVRIIGEFGSGGTENTFNEGIKNWNYGVVMEKVPTEFTPRAGFGNTGTYSKKSSDGKTLYWYDAGSESDQYNRSGSRYYVLAIT